MPFVLDASVALAWSFGDEPEPGGEITTDLFEDDHAIVPAVWPLEVANALAIAERQRRLSRSEAEQLTSLLADFDIEVEAITTRRALDAVLDIARDYGLSAYDAAYLEIAIRRTLPLATLDGRLRAAAERAGVSILS